MSTSYPTALDQYATVPDNQALVVRHRDRHQNIEDAMEAVQAKVGVTNSAVTSSFDYRIRALEQAVVIGNDWTPNGALVGNPDGTLGQVELTPNTVLARSSTGNVGAKPLTDFALTLLDDVDAASARTTIGAQQSNANLDGLSTLAVNGLAARTGAGTFAARTLTQPAAGITVTNGDGAAGNPTLALANDLAALEGLGAFGIPARTAADTWAVRTITGTAGRITVTNGGGVAGNPTLDIPTTLIDSGTYTPTLTNSTNVAASTAYLCRWSRNGTIVTVSGAVDIDPTAAGVTVLEISLPVASNFTSTIDCAGTTACALNAARAGTLSASVANDRAVLSFTADATVTNLTNNFVFQYTVLP